VRDIEYLGLFAGLMELLQLYLIGLKMKSGFICGVVAGICWIIFTIKASSAFGLLIICPLSLYLNARNYRLWAKDDAG